MGHFSTTDNDVLINSKIVYEGLVLIKMWLRLSEKNRKHPSFGASSKKMCVFDGKTWTFGRMLGLIPSAGTDTLCSMDN